LALTATATPLVKKDILSSLQLNNPKLFFTSFNRKEITYFIRNKDQMNPLKDLISFLNQHVKECGIIYCRTKNQVDELVNQLKRENIESVGFHSSKSNNERKSIQESWIKGDVPIIIATVLSSSFNSF
jgi:ATP-dependent DNA helicase RecQ